MMNMKHLRSAAIGLLISLASATFAQAQCSGQFQPGRFCGNASGVLGLPGPVLITPSIFQPIDGGTVIGNRTAVSAVPAATAAPVLGVPGSVPGTLGLAGATSGVVTIRGQAAAGTYNFNLPTSAGSAGQMLRSGGGGAAPMTFTTATWPSTTAINQLLYSNADNVVASSYAPVLGVAGVSGGSLGIAGANGVVTVRNSAAATYNFNLPLTAGTAGGPLLSGGGGTTDQSYGTRSGNTTKFATVTGPTPIDTSCVQFDASGNQYPTQVPCGTGNNVSYSQVFTAPTDFTPGTTTTLTVTNTPLSSQSTIVTFDGNTQNDNTWSLVGSTFTFSSPIPLGVSTVQIKSLSSTVLPTWVTLFNGAVNSVHLSPVNLIRNSSLSVSTAVSTVFVGNPIPISLYGNFASGGLASFRTPSGRGGLTPGSLVSIQGPTPHAPQTLTGITLTNGTSGGNATTIIGNAPTGSFAGVAQGDILWIKGGTYSAGTHVGLQMQCRINSTTDNGSVATMTSFCGPVITPASGLTFNLTYLQRSSTILTAVNGMPDTGNCCTGSPGVLTYPLQVLANDFDGPNMIFVAKLSGWAGTTGTGGAAQAYQVTTGDFGGSGQGPDFWTKSPTLQYFKMKGFDWDGTTPATVPGELYSAKMISGTVGAEYFYTNLDAQTASTSGADNPAGRSMFLGQTVTCRAALKNSAADGRRLFMYDGTGGFTYSSYVPANVFTEIEINRTISVNANRIWFGVVSDGAGNNVGDTAFFAKPHCAFTNAIGAGNYQRAPMSTTTFTNHINPWYYINRDVPAPVSIYIEQETSGALPSGLSMILSDIEAHHVGAGTSGIFLTDSDTSPVASAMTLYQSADNNLMQFSSGVTIPSSTSVYLGQGRTTSVIGEASWVFPMPVTISAVTGTVGTNTGGTSSYQVYVNGVPQALSCSITSGALCTSGLTNIFANTGASIAVMATSATAVTTHNVALQVTSYPLSHAVTNQAVAVGRQPFIVGANTVTIDRQVLYPSDANWVGLNIDQIGGVY